MGLPAVDITSSDFKVRAYDYYAKLRAQAPVQRVKLPNGNTAWLVSRYDDVAPLLRDARFAKDLHDALGSPPSIRLPGRFGFLQALERNVLDLDAPDHTRLRRLVHVAFTPRLVDRIGLRTEQIADELLDRARGKGTMDLISDYALAITLTVMSETLGIPTADQIRFHRWANAAVASTASPNRLRVPAIWRFVGYLRKVIAARRANPQDDLISALSQAQDASGGTREDELVAMIVLLVVAGHETTVNLIGNGALALLQAPAQLQRLRADPKLYPAAVEELLRFHSPIEVSTGHYAREMIEMGGVVIPTGGLVYGIISSANRDETQFDDPQRLDLGRERNRHLAFGQGIHQCLGAPFARLEGQIALRRLLERLPRVRLAGLGSSLRWRKGLYLRGLEALPVTW